MPILNIKNRSELLNNKVEEAFKAVSTPQDKRTLELKFFGRDLSDAEYEKNKFPAWGEKNGDENTYGLLGINEARLLEFQVRNNQNQKQFVILDIGGGNFSVLKSLSNEFSSKFPDIKFIFIGARGEPCNDKPLISNNTELVLFGEFFVENLTNELSKRNINYPIDIVLCNYTFRHLVLPVDLTSQIIDLLRPNSGILLADSFDYKLSNEQPIKTRTDYKKIRNNKMIWLLHQTGGQFLFSGEQDQYGQFIFKKGKVTSNLPLAYTDRIEKLINPQLTSQKETAVYSIDKTLEKPVTTQIIESSQNNILFALTGHSEFFNEISSLLPNNYYLSEQIIHSSIVPVSIFSVKTDDDNPVHKEDNNIRGLN